LTANSGACRRRARAPDRSPEFDTFQAMVSRVEGPQTPYEVYCYHCRVTFPVGTTRCLHCGGRVGGQPPRIVFGRTGPEPVAPPEAIGVEDELPSRAARLSPIALVWLMLAVGGALYRACAGP
jgi:hypothetical protein